MLTVKYRPTVDSKPASCDKINKKAQLTQRERATAVHV